MRLRVLMAAVIGALVLVAGISVHTIERRRSRPQTRLSARSQPERADVAAHFATTAAPTEPSTTATDVVPMATRKTTPKTTTTAASQPTTTTEAPQTDAMGTADLTFRGVRSGQLLGAVARCGARSNNESQQLTVNGTLNGTPWVLFVQSYDGENGVWQVLTGEAGGGTGLVGQGYGIAATYPETVQGVTQVDWAHGATLDVELASRYDQTPAGNVDVQGTITCA